jgi:hypothetical protein
MSSPIPSGRGCTFAGTDHACIPRPLVLARATALVGVQSVARIAAKVVSR